MRKHPTEATINGWKNVIAVCGEKRMTMRALLGCFGYKKRSPQVLAEIEGWLQEKDLFVCGLIDVPRRFIKVELDENVKITDREIRWIGDLAERESQLMEIFEDKILPTLPQLRRVVDKGKGYSPLGTKDKFDFLCEDKDGRSVVVELKRRDGERQGVEQVMRYIGQLKAEKNHKEPYGILITGYTDLHTRRALEGRQHDTHISWYIYGYKNNWRDIVLEEVQLNMEDSADSATRRERHEKGREGSDSSGSRGTPASPNRDSKPSEGRRGKVRKVKAVFRF